MLDLHPPSLGGGFPLQQSGALIDFGGAGGDDHDSDAPSTSQAKAPPNKKPQHPEL